jgi:hypothetical protein
MKTDVLQQLFPDETLAADVSYAASQWRHCEAEKNLLVAVLKDAILSYKKNLVCGGARFKEAERWIFSKDTDRLFAFETVCAMLGLSAQRIRQDLIAFAAVKLCAGGTVPHTSVFHS